jgi:protein gp37
MAETTKIEWADATVSMWWGCTRVSEACRNCYAESWANRWGKKLWGPGAPRERKKGAEALARRLNRQAERAGRRLRVFSASMSDWLDDEVPAEWLADLLALVAETPHLDWLLLSKRPHLWRARLGAACEFVRGQPDGYTREGLALAHAWLCDVPPKNAWVGATVEDQERADKRIPALWEIPAVMRFLSCEPLLGPLDLPKHLNRSVPYPAPCRGSAIERMVGWVIGGGESGRSARPTHPEWARSLRDQVKRAGAAFHWKQWGEWLPLDARGESRPTEGPPTLWVRPDGATSDGLNGWPGWALVQRVGKARAGRELDGREWNELPEVARAR